MVFYKGLLKNEKLTTADKVIYSYLTHKAVSHIDGIYDVDGDFLIENLQDFFSCNDDTFVSLSNMSLSKMANDTCFNLSQCKKSISVLKAADLVMYCDKEYHIKLIKTS